MIHTTLKETSESPLHVLRVHVVFVRSEEKIRPIEKKTPRTRAVVVHYYTINAVLLLYDVERTVQGMQSKKGKAKKHSTSLESRFPVSVRGTTIRNVALAVFPGGKITKPASPCPLPRYVPAVAKHSARRRERDEGVTGP